MAKRGEGDRLALLTFHFARFLVRVARFSELWNRRIFHSDVRYSGQRQRADMQREWSHRAYFLAHVLLLAISKSLLRRAIHARCAHHHHVLAPSSYLRRH